MKSTVSLEVSYSRERELRRLLFVCAQIKKKFYQSRGFLLFQEVLSNEDLLPDDVIILPEVLSALSKDFDWDEFDDKFWYSNYHYTPIPKRYLSLGDLFPEDSSIPDFSQDKIEECSKIVAELHDIDNLKINVYITHQGTKTTFMPDKVEPATVHVYARSDVEDSNIVYGVIGAVEVLHTRDNPPPWEERQAVRKYLFSKTRISSVLGLVETSPLEYTEKYKELYEISLANYKTLGFPVTPVITKQNDELILEDHGRIDFLSKSENLVLDLLTSRAKQIVVMDEIAELIWGDASTAKFSLQAISKVIERIRKKLREHGINKQVIFTKRGQGYLYFE